MNAPKGKTFIVRCNGRDWGPIPWQKLREWFGAKWLDPDLPIKPDNETDFKPASAFSRLWTIADRPFTWTDPSVGLASGKVPISRALKRFLRTELGWPGKVDSLNYYNADRLRKDLEKLFPPKHLLDDPDWPACWSGGSPAEEARREQQRRAGTVTDNQKAVLDFFGKRARTFGEASDTISELFSDPKKSARWEAEKARRGSLVPATEPQWIRLRFAAKRLNKDLPSVLTKTQASELIDEWYGDNPEIEDEYQDHKERIEEEECEQYRQELAEEFERPSRAVSSTGQPKRAKPQGCASILVIGVLVGASLVSAVVAVI